MDCKEFQLFVHAYIDGEFEPSDTVEIEAHLSTCPTCRSMVERESDFQAHIKKVYVPTPAPNVFHARIADVLEAQDAKLLAEGKEPSQGGAVAEGEGTTRRLASVEWIIGPLVAAAAALLLVLLAFGPNMFESRPAGDLVLDNRAQPAGPVEHAQEGVELPLESGAVVVGRGGGVSARSKDIAVRRASLEVGRARQGRSQPIVEEAVIWHRRNLPIEVAGPSNSRVRSWFDGKVNFPVRLPRFNKKQHREADEVSLLGARLSNVKERQAAYVVYEVKGSKMSVLAFDGKDIVPPEDKDRGQPIYFENANGYNVAVVEDNGITYSITSELPKEDMVKLVQTAFEPGAARGESSPPAKLEVIDR